VTLVHNPDYALGQMSSVRAGLAALSAKLDAVIVAVADQPLLNSADVTVLISAYKKHKAADDTRPPAVIVPHVAGTRANPIVLDAVLREEILAGQVDFGCRQWLAAHPEQLQRFDTDNQHYCVDVDTPEDLELFTQRYGHALRWPAA
jgi:CTP:molybdopterin cytidylyltransferase MocA